MREIIKKQLDNVKYADLSNYDEESNTYFIPKLQKIVLKENKCYIIKINPKLLDRGYNAVLESNWNNNKLPDNIYYKIEVNKMIGKMVKCTGYSYDIENKKDLTFWVGYFPINDIEIVEELY